MTSLGANRAPNKANRRFLWGCVVSLGLNVLLCARLFQVERVLGLELRLSIHPKAEPGGSPSSVGAVMVDGSTSNSLASTFRWCEIESADYRQYVANLRGIGCPEESIRDIICADIAGNYAGRAATIWKRQPWEYWRKPRGEQPSVAERGKLIALGKEQEAAIKELLGVSWHQQELIDLLFLQLHGPEQETLFLSPEKQEAALRALAESDYDAKEMKAELDDSRWERREELFKEKLRILATVLSPSEVEEYRLRVSPAAETLRMEVQYFDCTTEEFRALLDEREKPGQEKVAWGNLIDRTAATAQVRQLFGDERARQFERASDLVYINARKSADDNSLPPGLADQVWEIWRDAKERSEKIAGSEELTPEARRNQLSILAQKADSGISDLLGADVSRGVRRDVKNLLRNYEVRLGK